MVRFTSVDRDDWALEAFERAVGTVIGFETLDGDGSPTGERVAVEVAQVTRFENSGPRAQPFSVEFEAPTEPALAQGMVRVHLGDHDHLDVFVVPIQPRMGDRRRYEAIFN
jgi:hypothetical protein